jgi:uncharacterized membrane protein YvbJ
MKTCQHCGHQNPNHRELCLQCGKSIKKETRLSQIASGVMWIAGGIILILADTSFDLALFHWIRIPFGYAILGICIIIYGAGKIFSRKERPQA